MVPTTIGYMAEGLPPLCIHVTTTTNLFPEIRRAQHYPVFTQRQIMLHLRKYKHFTFRAYNAIFCFYYNTDVFRHWILHYVHMVSKLFVGILHCRSSQKFKYVRVRFTIVVSFGASAVFWSVKHLSHILGFLEDIPKVQFTILPPVVVELRVVGCT